MTIHDISITAQNQQKYNLIVHGCFADFAGDFSVYASTVSDNVAIISFVEMSN